MRIQLADLAGATVVQHFRCRPVAGDDVERYSYKSGDEFDGLERALAAAAGEPVTDKVVYEVAMADGRISFVQFTDWKVTFGTQTMDMSI